VVDSLKALDPEWPIREADGAEGPNLTLTGHRPEWGSAPQRPGPHFAVG
jgi:hypothetical protein